MKNIFALLLMLPTTFTLYGSDTCHNSAGILFSYNTLFSLEDMFKDGIEPSPKAIYEGATLDPQPQLEEITLEKTSNETSRTLIITKGKCTHIETTNNKTRAYQSFYDVKCAACRRLWNLNLTPAPELQEEWTRRIQEEKNIGSSLSIQAAQNNEEHDAANSVSSTPLHDAIKRGDTREIKRLLDNEADVNAKNRSGSTPLDRARTKAVAAVLQRNGGKEGFKY